MTEAMTALLTVVQMPVVLAQGSPITPGEIGVPAAGSFISVFKVIGMFVLVIPWLAAAPWIHRDSKIVRAPKGLWGSVTLIVGAAAFLVWLLLPYYLAGLLLYVMSILAIFISYLAYRNGRVGEDMKINILAMFMPKKQIELEKPLTKLRVYDAGGQIALTPNANAEQETIHAYNLAQDLLYDMIWRRAGDVVLSPSGQLTKVRFVIDGVTIARPALPLADSEAVIQYLKPLAGMNVDERRRPQKGRLAVDNVGTQVDIQLASAGTTSGQQMQFRIVKEFVQTDMDDLAMEPTMLAKVRDLNKADHGLFIVSGRPGSGVTSTMFSLLREHDAFVKQLATLEAEASIDLENISHHSYKDATKLPQDLASVLRRDPDVIMVDNCPEAQTAKLIFQAAEKKKLLLGLNAGDSFTALAKWVKVCGSAPAAMANLSGIICQMLLRTLCPECREPYRPDPQLLAKANIPAAKIDVFYRPPTRPLTDEKGNIYVCPKCQGSGYYGRTAIFELLEVTSDLKELVLSGASLVQIKGVARKRGMLYLQEQALQKVISRETSVQEVIRVSQQKK